VVFSYRAAIDTIDAPALACSRTTLVVDPLSMTSCGSSCIRPGTLSSLKQTSSSSLVPCVSAVALLLCLPHQQSVATGSLLVVWLATPAISPCFVVVLLLQPCYQSAIDHCRWPCCSSASWCPLFNLLSYRCCSSTSIYLKSLLA
jgi:hypothetical protein